MPAITVVVATRDRCRSPGLLCARVLVGEDNRLDPVSAFMERAPLGCRADLPGPSILGFLACAVAVRRAAFSSAPAGSLNAWASTARRSCRRWSWPHKAGISRTPAI